jgi:filamentous hemagglutinin family protein
MGLLHSTKQTVFTPLCLLTSFTLICNIPLTPPAIAQIIPDNSLGSENSVVVPNVNINGINSDRIDGGAIRGSNLFHSFQEFNIDNGRGAYFSNPENISNILSRVTGNNLSNILGTLGVLGNANLFLINPNGIVFGPNARLDVGGSFFASTADGILFENGVEFAASNPDAPPLLTINIPIGLNFRENPGTIVNQSIAVDSEDNLVGLEVEPQKTLGFVGGDIQLETSVLTASQGRIELGSVAGNSQVSLTPIDKGYALNYENVPNFQDILLSLAIVDVRGEGGGDIQVQGRRVAVTDGSIISARTQGSDPGGLLSIQASESVEVIDGQIFTNVDPGATGTGGSLTIDTPNLLVRDGAGIGALTSGNGDGGDLTVTAMNVELIDADLRALVRPGATGKGGTLTINTQRLQVRDGAQISASTFGNENGGDLNITATDIELIGTSVDDESPSGLFAQVNPGATGNGGNLTINTQNLLLQDGALISALVTEEATGNGGILTINTQNLSLQNGALISASTFGNGDGGDILITATDIELLGFGSALIASVQPEATGNAGSLTINTQNLRIQDGSQIAIGTFGQGDGGDVTVTAANVELIGSFSGIFAPVEPQATGNGGSLTIDTQRLRVQDGAQIGVFTKGDGDGGDVTVTATDIELIGRSADGEIPSALGASVSQGATGNGGSLTIDTQNLRVQDGAQISASTSGNGNGGDVTVTATDVELIGAGSVLNASVSQGATGNGGILTINTRNLLVQDGAVISASTFGNGNGGNLNVTATDVELIGAGSSLQTEVEPSATGDGGSLTVDTQRLIVQDDAEISASTFGNGDGGNLTIMATDIDLIGSVGALVAPEATGDGGTLTIYTQNLRVRDGGRILASTFGNGDGGNLTVTATDIELIGTVAASVAPEATGDGGTLTINTQNLRVRDGGQILASTFGNGDGGILTITATDIEVVGRSADGQFASSLLAQVTSEGNGNGGNLTINTQNLSVRDGAQISTGTFGNGDGGILTITATNIELVGTSAFTGLFTTAEPESTGKGGELTVNADNLTIRDGATIDVRSESTEAAGDLIINAPNIFLDNQATLNANTTAGEGDIILNTEDLRLRNNSNITTNATGEATGGNIEINTETLTALENSDISANAEDAFGGRVIINADGILGAVFRDQQSRFSDITATSELGPEFSGTVELNTELDPSSGLIDLSQTVVDPSDLIAQEFCRQRGGSEFVVTGKGGLAADPNDKADGNQIEVDLVEPVPSQPRNSSQRPSETEDNQPISSLDIIPARGWIRDENGDVILVSYDPTKTGVQRQPSQLPQCQPNLNGEDGT